MNPSFDSGQYLVVNEISYRFEKPDRGEVIVFKYPVDPSQYYIKRIIGLPGEVIEIKDGYVTIYNQEFPEGNVLDESIYLPKERITIGQTYLKLNEDEYLFRRQSSSKF